MCDPFSIAGMAASAGGSFLKGKAQQDYTSEVNHQNKLAYDISRKAREDERARQNAYEAEGVQSYENTAGQLTRENFDAKQQAGETRLLDLIASRPSAVASDTRLPGQDGASVAVQGANAATAAKTATDTRSRIQALAKVASLGGAGTERGIALQEGGNALSTLGGIRRGSLGVANQEQQIPAATVKPGGTTFADILSGIGGIMSLAGPGLPGMIGNSRLADPLFGGSKDLFANIAGTPGMA